MTADVLLELTGDIVATHVANNPVPADELPAFIRAVHEAFAALARPVEPAAPEFAPAVSLRRSLAKPDAIISMIDGKPYSVLKRHLSQHGLTPAAYRERYKLPADYPMTAPAYSSKRSALATQSGLGRREVSTSMAETGVDPTEAAESPSAADQAPLKALMPEVDTTAPDALLDLHTTKPKRGRPRKNGADPAGQAPSPAPKKPRLSGKAALAKVRGDG